MLRWRYSAAAFRWEPGNLWVNKASSFKALQLKGIVPRTLIKVESRQGVGRQRGLRGRDQKDKQQQKAAEGGTKSHS